VRVEAGVRLDGVADGLEHLAHVGGDVDEHERVELGGELRRGGGAGEVRAEEADRVRAGDGGAEERDGARLRARLARSARLARPARLARLASSARLARLASSARLARSARLAVGARRARGRVEELVPGLGDAYFAAADRHGHERVHEREAHAAGGVVPDLAADDGAREALEGAVHAEGAPALGRERARQRARQRARAAARAAARGPQHLLLDRVHVGRLEDHARARRRARRRVVGAQHQQPELEVRQHVRDVGAELLDVLWAVRRAGHALDLGGVPDMRLQISIGMSLECQISKCRISIQSTSVARSNPSGTEVDCIEYSCTPPYPTLFSSSAMAPLSRLFPVAGAAR
jgi:hypothetical protein